MANQQQDDNCIEDAHSDDDDTDDDDYAATTEIAYLKQQLQERDLQIATLVRQIRSHHSVDDDDDDENPATTRATDDRRGGEHQDYNNSSRETTTAAERNNDRKDETTTTTNPIMNKTAAVKTRKEPKISYIKRDELNDSIISEHPSDEMLQDGYIVIDNDYHEKIDPTDYTNARNFDYITRQWGPDDETDEFSREGGAMTTTRPGYDGAIVEVVSTAITIRRDDDDNMIEVWSPEEEKNISRGGAMATTPDHCFKHPRRVFCFLFILLLVIAGIGSIVYKYHFYSPADENTNENTNENINENPITITTNIPSVSPTSSYSPTLHPTVSSAPTFITLVPIGDPIYGTSSLSLFGFAISLSRNGQILTIGSPHQDGAVAGTTQAGVARAYQQQQEQQRRQQQGVSWEMMGPGVHGVHPYGYLGYTVPLSPDGDWYAVCGGLNSKPYVKVMTSSNNNNNKNNNNNDDDYFIPRGNPIKGPGVGFGLSLSLSRDGRRLAVGSRFYARLYQFDESLYEWVTVGDDIKESMVATVSLSGDGESVAVGCYGDDTEYTNAGRVRVFRFNSTITTTTTTATNELLEQVGQTLYGKAPEDGFGYAVSLSFDGTMIAIGTYGSNYVTLLEYGNDNTNSSSNNDDIHATDYNNWTTTKIFEGDEELDNKFGASLSLSDNARRIIIGSSKYDNDRGRAVVYQRSGSSSSSSTGGTTTIALAAASSSSQQQQQWKMMASVEGVNDDDREGYSVAISPEGKYFAVGAPYGDNVNGLKDSGRVRVFRLLSNVV